MQRIIAIGFIILFILMDAIKLKLLSIVLGVMVGILSYPYVQGQGQIQGQVQMHGPDSNIVRKEVYVLKNKCYKYEPIPYLCGVSSRSN